MTERHVLGLSGGRDSAALAVFMRQSRPEIDVAYFFTDTGKELPEVYEFLVGWKGSSASRSGGSTLIGISISGCASMGTFSPRQRHGGAPGNSSCGPSSNGLSGILMRGIG